MSKLVVLFFLFLSALSAFAADQPVFTAKLAADEGNGVSVETSTTAAITREEAEAATEWARQDLAKTLKQNPSVKPTITIAHRAETSATTASELDVVAKRIAAQDATIQKVVLSRDNTASLKARLNEWFENHYRVSFTVIRLVANGSAITWSLAISPDIAWEPALAVGLTAGGASAALMYYNQKYQKWLIGSGAILPQWIRYFGINVGYLSVIKFAGSLAQISHDATMLTALSSIAVTALTATIAQGPWNLLVPRQEAIGLDRIGMTVAKERGLVIDPNLKPSELRERLYEIASKNAPNEVSKLRLKTNVKVLGISMVATAVTVAALMDLPLADLGLWGLGIGGGSLWVKSLFDERQWTEVRRALLATCQANLTAAKP